MKNKIKLLLTAMIILSGIFENGFVSAAPVKTINPEAIKPVTLQTCDISVSPLDVVKNPAKYMNKTVTFNAEFVSFTALGLDYKPAMREASKYIGILIKRDDVKDHIIPLSEMKIFIKRDEAEKLNDIDSGDKIKITGKVFSTALGDPWVDISELKITDKQNKEKANEKK